VTAWRRTGDNTEPRAARLRGPWEMANTV